TDVLTEDYVQETTSQKEPMRSIGPLKVPRSSPKNYLKKQRKQPKAPRKQTNWSKGERHVCDERKPLIPDSKNKLQLRRKKIDYVTTAIAEQRCTDRSRPQAIADSHKGHKYFPENSGLFPQHVNKKVVILYLWSLHSPRTSQA
uniref:Uncharacterized protein n=1 Tax=Takifugu rubripes TaxID=31033 RepID=A0A674MXW3_TAKRU